MAHPLALGLAAIALGLFGAIAPAAGADGESEKFELTGRVRVVTGGIIVVARQEVHLWAIEAATLHQPCSPAKGLTCGEYARITLQQMATGRKVWCQIKERPEDALHVIARCELRNKHAIHVGTRRVSVDDSYRADRRNNKHTLRLACTLLMAWLRQRVDKLSF